MAEEMKVGCARPTGGPIGEEPKEQIREEITKKKEGGNMIKVGQKAPDFTIRVRAKMYYRY